MKSRFLAFAPLYVVSGAVVQRFSQESDGSGGRQLEQMRAGTEQQLTSELTAFQLKKFEVLMPQHHGGAPTASPNG